MKVLIILGIVYSFLCLSLYIFQEKLIFFPEKLDKNFEFTFDQEFEEMNIETQDGILLNGILFKAENSKGLIFYLHGNSGSLRIWGNIAKTYTDLNYDIFIWDYRGYGKSEGSINGEEQLFQDLQTVYDEMKKQYSEDKIVVLGYSIGSGLATKIASTNNPKLLILEAPYYSLTDLAKHNYSIIPSFLIRYKLESNEFIKDCKMPIVIFHGNKDKLIYYESSLKLKELLKPEDKLIILNGQGHNGITDNEVYLTEIEKILAE